MATKPEKNRGPALSNGAGRGTPSAVIPVIQEQATVRKRVVETGKVTISKRVREYEEVVDIPHVHEEVKVERVAVNQFVDEAPKVRAEGDITIVPVLEERHVVEKKLFLVEELHIRKDRIETHQPQTVTVLKEEVDVKRTGPAGRERKIVPAGRQSKQ